MTYTNPIPNNYNNTTISIDAGQVSSCLATIKTSVETIATSLQDINKVLNGLELNWLGDASNQAQTYNDNWNSAVQMLYGSQDQNGNGTDNGALSVLVDGLGQAIQNYSANEQAVAGLFSGFGGSGSGSNTATQNQIDKPTSPISDTTGITEYLYHTTAVNEKF